MIRRILARATMTKVANDAVQPSTRDLMFGALYLVIGTYFVQQYLRASNREMQAALAQWMFRRDERAKALGDDGAAYPGVDDLDPLDRGDHDDLPQAYEP